MNFILADDVTHQSLLPLTYTRPVAEIRVGITTIRDKWAHVLNALPSILTRPYLSEKYPVLLADINYLINSSVLPNEKGLEEIKALTPGQALQSENQIIACCVEKDRVEKWKAEFSPDQPVFPELNSWEGDLIESGSDWIFVKHPWDLFRLNGKIISSDYIALTENRTSAPLDPSNRTTGSNIFLEEGANVRGAFLNAETGPIYIGKNAEVMEGSMIRGPFSLGEHGVVKMGTKVYGPTTVGPHCKVGGEVSNSILFGYSNKGHDGFLGNSVIGEWCNLGADTNTSNLKNNYSHVKVWNYGINGNMDAGLQFCGLIMGDHSKSGINTMFNTGTVVGAFTNVFGAGFPPKFIPSFLWGGGDQWEAFDTDKAVEVATRMMARRKVDFTDADQRLLDEILRISLPYRTEFLK